MREYKDQNKEQNSKPFLRIVLQKRGWEIYLENGLRTDKMLRKAQDFCFLPSFSLKCHIQVDSLLITISHA